MPWWKRRTKHCVNKTRMEHKCEICKKIISKGSQVVYTNMFTGKRGYEHDSPPCLREILDRHVQENRERCAKLNQKAN